MKKNFLLACLSLLCTTLAITSCQNESKGGNEIPAPVDKPVTFTDESGLDLKINSNQSTGCTVNYTPSADDATKAVLAIEGAKTNLGTVIGGLVSSLRVESILSRPLELSAATRADVATGIVTSNVIPGSPVLTIPVDLEIDGKTGKFSGTGENQYCTYSYKGTVTESSLVLSIDDCKLKPNSLSGTSWKVAEPDLAGQKFGKTLLFDWKYIHEPATENYGGLLSERLLTDGRGLEIEAALCQIINAINFSGSGDITVTAMDTINLPAGLLGYVATNEKMILYPDILNIIEFVKANILTKIIHQTPESGVSTRSYDPTPMILSLVNKVSGILALAIQNGIPFDYVIHGEIMTLTLSNEFVKTLIASLQGLLNDAEFNTLIQTLINNSIEGLSPEEQLRRKAEAEALISSIIENVALTDSILIGINLQKIQQGGIR
ncbi:MAG: hypothetical protein J5732_08365 [Bacteroidaceae bacterium]|nr:hypothetical protein [Bacteroidaceae bacterium]